MSRWLYLLLTAVLSGPAMAESWISDRRVPVFSEPNLDSRIRFYIRPGDEILKLQEMDAFALVRVWRGNKVGRGYVYLNDFGRAVSRSRLWGWGLSALAGVWSQGQKRFDTQEGVDYSTSEYRGGSQSLLLTFVGDEEHSWRLHIGFMRMEFSTEATPNTGVASKKAVFDQQALVAGVQWAWSLGPSWLLGGFGAEVSRALSMTLKLDNSEIPVASEDYPLYLGGHLFLGAEINLSPQWSLLVEVRGQGILNKSPLIMGGQGVLSLLYWP